jgi:hypothetical protein
MKANKKLVQQKLTHESGNILLLKNISNIATSLQREKSEMI